MSEDEDLSSTPSDPPRLGPHLALSLGRALWIKGGEII